MKLDSLDPKLRARVEAAMAAEDALRRDLRRQIPGPPSGSTPVVTKPPRPGKRIRQSHKQLLNKLETDFMTSLVPPFDSEGYRIVAQGLRFRLANGLWYKPDFLKVGDDTDSPLVAYEVKGPHSFRGGFENLKMAATTYPWIKWVLVWKDPQNGQWVEQVVLP